MCRQFGCLGVSTSASTENTPRENGRLSGPSYKLMPYTDATVFNHLGFTWMGTGMSEHIDKVRSVKQFAHAVGPPVGDFNTTLACAIQQINSEDPTLHRHLHADRIELRVQGNFGDLQSAWPLDAYVANPAVIPHLPDETLTAIQLNVPLQPPGVVQIALHQIFPRGRLAPAIRDGQLQ